jgi:hypothetical protein
MSKEKMYELIVVGLLPVMLVVIGVSLCCRWAIHARKAYIRKLAKPPTEEAQ